MAITIQMKGQFLTHNFIFDNSCYFQLPEKLGYWKNIVNHEIAICRNNIIILSICCIIENDMVENKKVH
jgi:hypothetical protein